MLIKFTDIEENVKPQKEYAEGRYKVRITKAIEETPTDKTPYLEVTFETTEDNIFSVRKRFYQTPKALSILLNLLSACGLYDSTSKEDLQFNPEDLVGCLLEVEFKKGEANAEGRSYLEYQAWSAKSVGVIAIPTKTETPKADEVLGKEECPF